MRDRLDGDRGAHRRRARRVLARRPPGSRVSKARKRLDADEAARDLAQITSASPEPPVKGGAIEKTVEALQAQLSSAQRMDKTIAEAQDQLRLIDARLDEAAARAIELSVNAERRLRAHHAVRRRRRPRR